MAEIHAERVSASSPAGTRSDNGVQPHYDGIKAQASLADADLKQDALRADCRNCVRRPKASRTVVRRRIRSATLGWPMIRRGNACVGGKIAGCETR